MKKIVILGSTGSVGETALQVVRKFNDRFSVEFLSCKENISKLEKQILEFKPKAVYIENENKAEEIKRKFTYLKVFSGKEEEEFLNIESDLIFNSISGISGVKPSLSALRDKRLIALSNKETIVSGGELIKEYIDKIIPVDSEHSSLFQLLESFGKENIKRLYITASGGPFLKKEIKKGLKKEEVLNHPVWNMGGKITVDSATMMNKVFEIIEAHYLFEFNADDIEVVFHPQSFIHGAVELRDGNIVSLMSFPDMIFPVAYSLFYPERPKKKIREYSIFDFPKVEIIKPDFSKFELLELAYDVIKSENGKGLVLNVSDEVAVKYFLKNKIDFTDIFKVIKGVYQKYDFSKPDSFDKIIEIHKRVEEFTMNFIEEVIL